MDRRCFVYERIFDEFKAYLEPHKGFEDILNQLCQWENITATTQILRHVGEGDENLERPIGLIDIKSKKINENSKQFIKQVIDKKWLSYGFGFPNCNLFAVSFQIAYRSNEELINQLCDWKRIDEIIDFLTHCEQDVAVEAIAQKSKAYIKNLLEEKYFGRGSLLVNERWIRLCAKTKLTIDREDGWFGNGYTEPVPIWLVKAQRHLNGRNPSVMDRLVGEFELQFDMKDNLIVSACEKKELTKKEMKSTYDNIIVSGHLTTKKASVLSLKCNNMIWLRNNGIIQVNGKGYKGGINDIQKMHTGGGGGGSDGGGGAGGGDKLMNVLHCGSGGCPPIN